MTNKEIELFLFKEGIVTREMFAKSESSSEVKTILGMLCDAFRLGQENIEPDDFDDLQSAIEDAESASSRMEDAIRALRRKVSAR